MRMYQIYEQLPGITLRLFHSKRKLRSALRKLGMNDTVGSSDALTCYKEGDRNFLVYIDKRALHYDAAEDIGLLAHEATHVAQGYFRAIGEEQPSDEFQAYTVQAVTQELCNRHFEWKKRRLKKQ